MRSFVLYCFQVSMVCIPLEVVKLLAACAWLQWPGGQWLLLWFPGSHHPSLDISDPLINTWWMVSDRAGCNQLIVSLSPSDIEEAESDLNSFKQAPRLDAFQSWHFIIGQLGLRRIMVSALFYDQDTQHEVFLWQIMNERYKWDFKYFIYNIGFIYNITKF